MRREMLVCFQRMPTRLPDRRSLRVETTGFYCMRLLKVDGCAEPVIGRVAFTRMLGAS